jgi:hypothetical protein
MIIIIRIRRRRRRGGGAKYSHCWPGLNFIIPVLVT